MSDLKNKLYNYEQTPPEKAWDKIAAALDESHIENKFPSKLYNYEQAPPKKNWEKIAIALDESHVEEGFPYKLYHAEVVPPSTTWEKIAGALEEEEPKVVPMRRRGFTIFRYAAAAVIVGIIAFTVFKLTSANNGGSSTESIVADENHDTPGNTDMASEEKSNPSATEEIHASVQDENRTQEKAAESRAGLIKKVRSRYTVSENIDPTEAVYAYNEHTPNLADRYIMLMTPNGIIRMSKKWGELVCCVSGQEQDANCKDQIKKLQEKLASSPGTSTGNFMDILSLVSSLDKEL